MPKPLPDLTSPEWERSSPRAKLHVLREFVLNHEGPLDQADVRRIMAAMCRFTIEIVSETHMTSKHSMDQVETARLLHAEAAMYDREPA